MPNYWMKNPIAAAALLTLTGTVAFAQPAMKLDVPFAFQITKTSMPAGKYKVEAIANRVTPAYIFRHESGKTALVPTSSKLSRRGSTAIGQLAFRCTGGDCALEAVYPAFASVGDRVPTRSRATQELKTAEVHLVTAH